LWSRPLRDRFTAATSGGFLFMKPASSLDWLRLPDPRRVPRDTRRAIRQRAWQIAMQRARAEYSRLLADLEADVREGVVDHGGIEMWSPAAPVERAVDLGNGKACK